ncbi:MAG: hypothetical protein F4103_16755 [Boseongicola sp. SB0673_bin_14]|nr:hypothetical protein [Chloroflexota bacterium]MYI70311.1 hypothetical protein [Boseongicola sp. SB0673_bin_14]
MPQLESPPPTVHRCDMEMKAWKSPRGFWALALCWLPAGVIVQAAVRFVPQAGGAPEAGMLVMAAVMSVPSLVILAPCGLPLALGCRRLWRLGRRQTAWWLGASLGALTVAGSVFAGLLGPVAIAVVALLGSVPVWAASWWLARRG